MNWLLNQIHLKVELGETKVDETIVKKPAELAFDKRELISTDKPEDLIPSEEVKPEEEVTTDITTKKLRNENPRNLEPDTEFVKPEEGELVETKVEETIEIIEKKPDDIGC